MFECGTECTHDEYWAMPFANLTKYEGREWVDDVPHSLEPLVECLSMAEYADDKFGKPKSVSMMSVVQTAKMSSYDNGDALDKLERLEKNGLILLDYFYNEMHWSVMVLSDCLYRNVKGKVKDRVKRIKEIQERSERKAARRRAEANHKAQQYIHDFMGKMQSTGRSCTEDKCICDTFWYGKYTGKYMIEDEIDWAKSRYLGEVASIHEAEMFGRVIVYSKLDFTPMKLDDVVAAAKIDEPAEIAEFIHQVSRSGEYERGKYVVLSNCEKWSLDAVIESAQTKFDEIDKKHQKVMETIQKERREHILKMRKWQDKAQATFNRKRGERETAPMLYSKTGVHSIIFNRWGKSQ